MVISVLGRVQSSNGCPATSHVVDGDGAPTGALSFSNWEDGKTLQGQVIPAVLPDTQEPAAGVASAWCNGSVLKFEGLQVRLRTICAFKHIQQTLTYLCAVARPVQWTPH